MWTRFCSLPLKNGMAEVVRVGDCLQLHLRTLLDILRTALLLPLANVQPLKLPVRLLLRIAKLQDILPLLNRFIILASLTMAASPSETWQDKVARKQVAIKAAIPSEWLLPSDLTISSNVLDVPRQCGILSEKELEITESFTARQIVDKLSTRNLTSAEVTMAFSKRAAIAQQLVISLLFPGTN